MRKSQRIFFPLLVAFLGACPGPEPTHPIPTEDTVTFLVLGDNDFHGAIDGRTLHLTLADGSPYEMKVGGAEYIAAYYKRLRDAYPGRVIQLAAGDIFQGTPVSNHSEGKSVLLFLNYLGYDAAAIGNHEFDYGPKGPLSVPEDAERDDPFGALKELLTQAEFPFLSANIREKSTQKPPSWERFAPYLLIEREGVKIGIIGLTTEMTPTTTQPPNVASLEFLPLAEATLKAAKELREKGAEILLVVAHAGTECTDLSDPKSEKSCDQSEEIPRMLRALPPGTIDALVAGHTHAFVANEIAGVPVISSGANGTAFGRIELVFDRKTRTLLKERTRIFPPQDVCQIVFVETGGCGREAARASSGKTKPAEFLGAPIAPDEKVTALLKEPRAAVESLTREVLAEVARPIFRNSQKESAMGNLVTDLMRAATGQEGIPQADFAIQNSGGLRADLSAGPLTYGALFEVLPFENVLVTARLTGRQVQRIFELAMEERRIFQVSGLKVIYQSTPKEGTSPGEKFRFDDYEHTVLRVETEDGAPLDPERTYSIIWNDFLANGGNAMSALVRELPEGAMTYHYNLTLREAVAEKLRAYKEPINTEEKPLIDPKKPRIVFEVKR